jgi:hypothetical protein
MGAILMSIQVVPNNIDIEFYLHLRDQSQLVSGCVQIEEQPVSLPQFVVNSQAFVVVFDAVLSCGAELEGILRFDRHRGLSLDLRDLLLHLP